MSYGRVSIYPTKPVTVPKPMLMARVRRPDPSFTVSLAPYHPDGSTSLGFVVDPIVNCKQSNLGVLYPRRRPAVATLVVKSKLATTTVDSRCPLDISSYYKSLGLKLGFKNACPT